MRFNTVLQIDTGIFWMGLMKKIETSLQKLGFVNSGKSFPEFYDWLKTLKSKKIPTLKKIQDKLYSYSSILFSEFKPSLSGNFGNMYLVYRQNKDIPDDEKYVFIKTCQPHKNSLMIEAIIQLVAQNTLEYYGFPTAIPKILDIVNHPDYGPVFSVERVQNGILFADFLKYTIQWENPSISNDMTIFSILAQVTTYMAILEKVIGINHRDLKSDNVLVIVPQDRWTRTIKIDEEQFILSGNYTAVIVDFGFSCIGTKDGSQIISAGEFFPVIDFCPKKGRDLFYMLATLWNVKAFRTSLTENGKKLFHKWLRDTSKRDWPNLLKLNSENNLKEILLRSCSNDFQSESSQPLEILKDISSSYPQIIRFV
jgi:serine/threonine protein kinase